MAFAARAGTTAAAANATAGGLVPAELGFLAIYNPSLGTTDETLEDQIVYYYSAAASAPSSGGAGAQHRRSVSSPTSLTAPTRRLDANERNERLRQIGLAQGMIAFGKSFAGDQPVDSIETDKTRVILHELEPGWWILVSVNLTRLPLPGGAGAVEYSSREVKPAVLLLQDLLRAHAVFLLHHDVSLAALYTRLTTTPMSMTSSVSSASSSSSFNSFGTGASASASAASRAQFTGLLARFWDVFLFSWSVLLHGNPVRDVLPGVRMAACGELGVGVGEEDRGSGEREVLEGLVEQTHGLVDLVVCKFGGEEDDEAEAATDGEAKRSKQKQKHLVAAGEDSSLGNNSRGWLGTGREPGAEDGAIFLGVGALTRASLRTITYWMEDIYSWGPHAYGITENPSTIRRKRRRRKASPMGGSIQEQPEDQGQPEQEQEQQQHPVMDLPPLLPPLPVTQLARRSRQFSNPIPISQARKDVPDHRGSPASLDRYMSFMKLGYGTYWGAGSGGSSSNNGDSVTSGKSAAPTTTGDNLPADKRPREPDVGHFLVGLTNGPEAKESSKAVLRSVVVEMADGVRDAGESQGGSSCGMTDGNGSSGQTKKLRVVVFAKRPFLYTFLFRAEAAPVGTAADDAGLQAMLSQQVVMLHKALLGSTAYRPDKPSMAHTVAASASLGTIYDLIWDPQAMTIHSTIPNIPNIPTASGRQAHAWTRVEALNTHMQLLSMFVGTRANAAELERTCKTSRGWWIVWNRVVERSTAGDADGAGHGNSTAPSLLEADEDEADTETGTETGTAIRTGDSDAASDVSHASSHTARGAAASYTVSKEIFLIRRAGEHSEGKTTSSAAMRVISASYLGRGSAAAASSSSSSGGGGGSSEGWMGSGGWADGATRLAQGMGVDTKKYIEGLLSLNR